MSARPSLPREASKETANDPDKLTGVPREALADILRQAIRDASAKTPDEADLLLREALGPNRECRRRTLRAAFQIRLLGEEKVSLTLPQGISRAEFLKMVQPVAKEVYGGNAVYPPFLAKWVSDEEFTARPSNDVVISIDGNVEGSTNKTRREQEAFLKAKGLQMQMPTLPDLVVAHAAYFLAEGDNLFDGRMVRARVGKLYFDSRGLYECSYNYDDVRLPDVAASASLPARTEHT